MAQKLVLAMVGLPARGKSTMARKIAQSFQMDGLRVKVFNNGELRRRLTGPETSHPDFFSPSNLQAVELRERLARTNLELAGRYLEGEGDVAIVDAANVTVSRRRMIQEFFKEKVVLFLECVNSDREVLEANLARKAGLEEFRNLSPGEALESFRSRISHYESIYEPLKEEKNRLVVDSFECCILKEEFSEEVPYYERLRDVILTRYVNHLYLVRHGETLFNLQDRIGGDPELTPRGWEQARALAMHFKPQRIPLVFTSSLKRTRQTAIPVAQSQEDCTIIPLPEFDEIHSGICEEMTYQEIRDRFPHVAEARRRDKYGYVYPGGEGYSTMEARIERGLRKVFYLSRPEDTIMIVGHRAVNRMILSHFVFRRKEEVPYIYMPQDGYYHIVVTPNLKLFELKRF
jgi:broad specificity phosphatase PhoE/predicted kinase